MILRLEKTALASHAAAQLLVDALPHDPLALVVQEKLWGENGRREGSVWGAFDGETLVGAMAIAGRFIKLIAVAERARCRGFGTALLAEARTSAGAGSLRIGDHPGNYLSPGIDARYIEGIAFFERQGFVRVGEVENLRASLTNNPLVTPERRDALVHSLAHSGLNVERVTTATAGPLLDFIANEFAPVWAFEVRRALDGPCRAVHAAFADGRPIAFAAADGNNRGLGWFGPAGTAPNHRGRGIGEALLVSCLLDVVATAEGGVIAWIGPKAFYARAIGAVSDRRFIQLEAKP